MNCLYEDFFGINVFTRISLGLNIFTRIYISFSGEARPGMDFPAAQADAFPSYSDEFEYPDIQVLRIFKKYLKNK